MKELKLKLTKFYRLKVGRRRGAFLPNWQTPLTSTQKPIPRLNRRVSPIQKFCKSVACLSGLRGGSCGLQFVLV
jgi:hypothetical protein